MSRRRTGQPLRDGDELVVAIERSRAELGQRIRVAARWHTRLRGLLGTNHLERGAGLLLHPANGVHTFGMRYPIDVVFVDAKQRVTRVVASLPPGSLVPWVRGAREAIELPEGTCERAGLRRGDVLVLANADA